MTSPPAFTPLGFRVLVKRLPTPATAGLIHIPEAHQEATLEAEVVVLGTGHDEKGRPVDGRFTVRAGDRVLITKFGGTNLQLDGERFVLVKESDIQAIIKP